MLHVWLSGADWAASQLELVAPEAVKQERVRVCAPFPHVTEHLVQSEYDQTGHLTRHFSVCDGRLSR